MLKFISAGKRWQKENPTPHRNGNVYAPTVVFKQDRPGRIEVPLDDDSNETMC
jgi:hypothetical protein